MIVSVFCQRAKMNQKWMNNTKTSLSSYLKVVSVHPSLILLPSLILGCFSLNKLIQANLNISFALIIRINNTPFSSLFYDQYKLYLIIVSVFWQRVKMNQWRMDNTRTSLWSYLIVVSVHPSLILLPSLIHGCFSLINRTHIRH